MISTTFQLKSYSFKGFKMLIPKFNKVNLLKIYTTNLFKIQILISTLHPKKT